MGRSDENYQRLIRPSNIQGLGGNKRRALSTISTNNIVAAPYPCAVHKRGVFTEKNAATKDIPVHRPVTRKSVEQLILKERKPSLKRETKAQAQPVLTTNQTKDCIFVYEDDCKTMDVPMFERTDRMDSDEVEMEDIEDPVLDIDSADKKNSLAVTQYIDDIYTFYKQTENLSCVPPYYMSNQPDINERMRGILIDWLIEVHYKFELMDETLYLMVNLIDRFLAVQSVARKKLQLVGVTALFLASKYEEVSVPVVEDLILISDKAYNRKEVLDMEKMMVNALQFNMSVPTPYVFMRRFLKAAQADKKLELLSYFLIELCLVEYEMLKFPPSLLAAAAIFTAQCTFTGHKEWSKTSKCHTNYTEDQLMECAKLMVIFHEKAGNGKLTGVHKKYSTSKYGYAARIEPAVFLINGQE